MSDLCAYEFEDRIWDEFCQSKEHIGLYPGFEQTDNHSRLGDIHKAPCCEVTNISNSTEDRFSAGYADKGTGGGVLSLSRMKNTMLEKDTWPHAPNGVISPSDGDSIREASSLASENATPSCHELNNNNVNSTGDEFCGTDAILGDEITDVDNNPSTNPLSGANHMDNNLSFFENAENKDSSDFLYYGWPEIENFEDVDRIFRSCDSTFGLEASKENELDWFSPADNIGGPGDVMSSDFNFSCPESDTVENITPDHDSSKRYSFTDSATMSAHFRLKDSPWTSEKSDSYMSFLNGPAIGNGKEEFLPKAQMNEPQKQVKPQNQSEGKRKEHDVANGCVNYMNKLPTEVMQLPSGPVSHQVSPSVCMQQQALGSDPCNYVQNHLSYMHSDNSPISDLTSVDPTSFAVKSETNDLKSLSKRDSSSNASNWLPSMDGCHGSPLVVTTPTGTGKRDKQHNHQGKRSSQNSSLKHKNAVAHAALDDLDPMAKEAWYPGAKSENLSDIEGGSLFLSSELGSSNIQESSTMSSGVDDTSMEAASFRQLQLVMEQLDMRTKICIRDSLYRLARSAEQRHNHANLNGRLGNGRDADGSLVAERENNFMDIETDTNPIDRSVAHLLFHRPSESSPVPPAHS